MRPESAGLVQSRRRVSASESREGAVGIDPFPGTRSPDFVEALYDIGVIEQEGENWSGAFANYERAVQKRSDYWPAWNNMGNTLFAMGRTQRAMECFEKSLSSNPD